MKKLTLNISSLGVLFLSSVSQAVAQKIEVGPTDPQTCAGCDAGMSFWTAPALVPFFEYLDALNTISIWFLVLSQIIFIAYVIWLLVKVYILKTIQLGNLIKRSLILFLCGYLFSVLIVTLHYIRYIMGY